MDYYKKNTVSCPDSCPWSWCFGIVFAKSDVLKLTINKFKNLITLFISRHSTTTVRG